MSEQGPNGTTQPTTPQAPAAAQAFYALVQDITAPAVVDERRSEERYARTVALDVQPLDEDFQPCGESFCAVTRDISRGGLGFINNEPFDHQYLKLTLPDQPESTVIGRVCYNLSIGVGQPLFLVGVQFVQ